VFCVISFNLFLEGGYAARTGYQALGIPPAGQEVIHLQGVIVTLIIVIFPQEAAHRLGGAKVTE
jgi:hypothetical protein